MYIYVYIYIYGHYYNTVEVPGGGGDEAGGPGSRRGPHHYIPMYIIYIGIYIYIYIYVYTHTLYINMRIVYYQHVYSAPAILASSTAHRQDRST